MNITSDLHNLYYCKKEVNLNLDLIALIVTFSVHNMGQKTEKVVYFDQKCHMRSNYI